MIFSVRSPFSGYGDPFSEQTFLSLRIAGPCYGWQILYRIFNHLSDKQITIIYLQIHEFQADF
jgi:hypothetical protein